VNLQRMMSIWGLVVLGLLQVGCASSPTTTVTDIRPGLWDAGDRPRMLFPGAKSAEVKSLAMGAARSRGWTIVESRNDRIVAQRALDPGSALASQMGRSDGLVEVTAYFVEQRGNLQVAMDAAVVTPTAGSDRPARSDATEMLRPVLTDSLESLHASWSKHRGRVANAAPPLGGAMADEEGEGGADGTIAELDSERNPAAWTNEAAAEVIAPSVTQAPPPRALTPYPTPAPSVPAVAQRPEAAPGPRAFGAAPVQRAQPSPTSTWSATSAPSPIASLPASRIPAGRPAPVVDASSISARSAPTTPATTRPMTLPESAPAPTSSPEPPLEGDNMLALYPPSTTVNWSYYAEQYARLRGCNVSPQGAILIDSRTDGEILKVPCNGADSMLVQCHNGDCRGLL
jgi:hypothetical protein